MCRQNNRQQRRVTAGNGGRVFQSTSLANILRVKMLLNMPVARDFPSSYPCCMQMVTFLLNSQPNIQPTWSYRCRGCPRYKALQNGYKVIYDICWWSGWVSESQAGNSQWTKILLVSLCFGGGLHTRTNESDEAISKILELPMSRTHKHRLNICRISWMIFPLQTHI